MRGCFVAKRTTGYGRSPTERKPVFAVGSTITKSKIQLAFIAMATLCRSDHACLNTSAQKIPAKIANWQTRRKMIIACCTTYSSIAPRGVDVGYHHQSNCACSSRRGCSKLLTIDNRAAGDTPLPAAVVCRGTGRLLRRPRPRRAIACLFFSPDFRRAACLSFGAREPLRLRAFRKPSLMVPRPRQDE
jgi:hypothetical protein